MKLATVEQMREMDRLAIEKFGVAEEILMENAALAAVVLLQREIGIHGRKFAIFCGVGNNGGDGLALARLIHSQGGKVQVFLVASPKKYIGAARTNYDIACNLSLDVHLLTKAEEARPDVFHSDAVVDAIFGTGLDREVKGLPADAIALINACGKPVMSRAARFWCRIFLFRRPFMIVTIFRRRPMVSFRCRPAPSRPIRARWGMCFLSPVLKIITVHRILRPCPF